MTTMLDKPIKPEFDQARYDAGDYDGIIERLDKTGDSKTMWSKDDPGEVAMAQAAFDAAKRAGMLIYRAVGKKGERGEKVTKFDPTHERLIMVPQPVGG